MLMIVCVGLPADVDMGWKKTHMCRSGQQRVKVFYFMAVTHFLYF